ncbi:MAG: hypothetical protein ABI068_05555 [Ktedonobacterales bacterium]
MRKLTGYILLAVSIIGGIYLVFVFFDQWLGSGTTTQLLLDGGALVAAFIVFCVGYYLVTALERQ